jgi:hypothetical protein
MTPRGEELIPTAFWNETGRLITRKTALIALAEVRYISSRASSPSRLDASMPFLVLRVVLTLKRIPPLTRNPGHPQTQRFDGGESGI